MGRLTAVVEVEETADSELWKQRWIFFGIKEGSSSGPFKTNDPWKIADSNP